MMDSVKQIDWLGHASFRLRGEKTVYIDPWKLQSEPHDADLVLVTHSHYDHLSAEDIAKVSHEETIVVGPASDKEELAGLKAELMQPGDRNTFAGINLQAVRAYNIDKKFHPREKDWLGYVIDFEGVRVYHTGDTDLIDEMNGLACDIALLPVSGTYVMTADEAVDAARRTGAKLAVPMHWGDIVGGRDDAEKLLKSAPCQVVIKDIVP